jgi:hypothetical protein
VTPAFLDTTPLYGLKVGGNKKCPRCEATNAIVGRGVGPHAAGLVCADCGRHRGWLPEAAARTLVEVTERFGRPEGVAIKNIKEHSAALSSAGEAMSSNGAQPKPERRGNMPNVKDVYKSNKFLKGSEIDGVLRTKITDVVEQELMDFKTGGKKPKLVATLSATTQPWVINPTNADILSAEYGEDTDNWVGKTVDLTPWQTQKGVGIQVKIVKKKPGTVSVVPPPDDFPPE